MSDRNVIIICVSREVLEGSVVDRNAAFMATRINGLGLRVRTILVCDRAEGEMVTALKWALEQKPAFLVMSGAMGPSFDDNARACLAKAVGATPVESAEALECIKSSYRRLHAKGLIDDPEVDPDRARMAMVPPGARCFENAVGSAPGVELKAGPTTVFLLPGVPSEMQALFAQHALPRMMEQSPSTLRKQRTVDCDGGDEAALSRILSTVAKRHPKVELRTRMVSRENIVQIILQAEHHDPVGLDEMLEQAELDLRSRLGLETGPGD